MYFVNCVTQKSKTLIDMNSILDKNMLLYAERASERASDGCLVYLFVCLLVCLFVCSFRRPSKLMKIGLNREFIMRWESLMLSIEWSARSHARLLPFSLSSMRFACFRWEWFMSLICSAWHRIFFGCRLVPLPAADGYCCWWCFGCYCHCHCWCVSSNQLNLTYRAEVYVYWTAKKMIVIHTHLHV